MRLFLLLQKTEHPWLKNADRAPNVSLGEIVRSRLMQFSAMNKFKKKALGVSCREPAATILIFFKCGVLLHCEAFADEGRCQEFTGGGDG